MRIAIDIDGTLCWANLPVFLDECNRQFHLNVDSATLGSLETKEAFYALPEVQAVRSDHPYLEDELAWIEYRERCILASLPLDNAAEGVAKLGAIGDITYYTSRYCEEPKIQIEIEQSTKKWLKLYRFSNKPKIIFCNRIQGKVLEILNIAKSEYTILIDDSYVRVIEEIHRLKSHEYAVLQERLLLVAMRAYDYELPLSGLNLVALPSWEDLENILERILMHGRQSKTAETTRDSKAAKAPGNTQAEPI
ncbi:hypothetical protein KDH_80130 [Dictyobacter sp. S3.2.2.5]|uniref:Uncharacterized protein n=1 Tax=Dictyobacter halimunensis TaxID=3026934 RepID=A0ABQ6G3V5_9CHLR|nr:hypothetical protein KDH_80130 [Dictyobacter sp. S3.2.2.5]